MAYSAYVSNVGHIGNYPTIIEAIFAIRETIADSSCADPEGYVLDASGKLAATAIAPIPFLIWRLTEECT